MSESEFGSAGIYRVLKKAGAERVGDDAVTEFRAALEEIGVKIGQKAVEMADHAGRRTVKATDVKLAVKTFLER
ncbi:MAG: NFYB/HAP3 family transcription factor subunit [Nitrososphaerota archaeon]|nr:NFYB/HAP3 family transcription factor subunit [Nitrososphaerota archaeon]MDG6939668.1 NFYB/HAP3 family transcription factor subunit [Nitrososphaerota archaeon]